MTSNTPGDVEVTNVSKHGFWLLLDDQEVFLPFEQFPWFRDAPIGKLVNVQLPSSHHLYWPDLDVDLAVDSISTLSSFPSSAKTSRVLPPESANAATRHSPYPAN